MWCHSDKAISDKRLGHNTEWYVGGSCRVGTASNHNLELKLVLHRFKLVPLPVSLQGLPPDTPTSNKKVDTALQKPCDATEQVTQRAIRIDTLMWWHRRRVGIRTWVYTCSCSTWASNLATASKLASCAASFAVASAYNSKSSRSTADTTGDT